MPRPDEGDFNFDPELDDPTYPEAIEVNTCDECGAETEGTTCARCRRFQEESE